MAKITKVLAREILDSRGNPTVEAEVYLDSGISARAAAPSGASTGSKEALELRDNDANRYDGKGVMQAVEHVQTTINQVLQGCSCLEQAAIDRWMNEADGTDNKSILGANAILPVSLAVAKAAAKSNGLPLYAYIAQLHGTPSYCMPIPMMNILNGGAHANNNLDIQEFMICPVGASCFKEGVRMGCAVFHQLKKILEKRGQNTAVGDEGGFAPDVPSNEEALLLIHEAIEAAEMEIGTDITLALDCAASEFYHDGGYYPEGKHKRFDAKMLTTYLKDLAKKFTITSIEDGLDETDWAGWAYLTMESGAALQLVGDDLFVTNKAILQQGIEQNIANAILIKLNQIGTLTETLETIKIAQTSGYATIISHRSGETEDTTIADLAVGTGAGQIKTGSLCRSDRVAKYNQLLRIEEYLGGHVSYGAKR